MSSGNGNDDDDDPPPRHVHDPSKCFEVVLVHDDPLHDHDWSCHETQRTCGFVGEY